MTRYSLSTLKTYLSNIHVLLIFKIDLKFRKFRSTRFNAGFLNIFRQTFDELGLFDCITKTQKILLNFCKL